MSDTPIKLQPQLHVRSFRVMASSLDVAKVFGKLHKNVLRDIENLEVPEAFNRLNFEPVEYLDAKGELRPAMEMTRDGFTVLVMGFTGAKAMEFKLAYMAEFNRMEAVLRQGTDFHNAQINNPEHFVRIPGRFSVPMHARQGRCWVSSDYLADSCRLEHRSLMRRVKSLRVDEDFRIRHIAESAYLSANGGQYPCYMLDRDAALLVLGGSFRRLDDFMMECVVRSFDQAAEHLMNAEAVLEGLARKGGRVIQ